MSIKIGEYTFEGPYISENSLKDKSGIYAILCKQNSGYKPLDIGESCQVKTRVMNHDRRKCWQKNCSGMIAYAVFYMPHIHQAGRMKIEQKLRRQYNPPCGDK